MSMNKSNEQMPGESTAADPSEGVEPKRVALVEVSHADDGAVVAAEPLIIAYPGDEIILITSIGEERTFRMELPEDFPLDQGAVGSATHAAPMLVSGKGKSVASAAVLASVGVAGSANRTLHSGSQQAIRLRIDANATPGRYGYGLEADIPKVQVGVAFAGGVIIRPVPPRPLV